MGGGLKTPWGGPPPPTHFWRAWPDAARPSKAGFEAGVLWLGTISANFCIFWLRTDVELGVEAAIAQLEVGVRNQFQFFLENFEEIVPKPSQIEPRGLQNRALEPPKSRSEPSKKLSLKDLQLKTAPRSLRDNVWRPKYPTWLFFGGPRGSKIEAETQKKRC